MQKLFILILISNFSYALTCWSLKKELAPKCKGTKVHLTFDDGPDKNVTPKILDTLRRHGTKASFYISTKNVRDKKDKEVVQKILSQGHLLASHGHNHHAHDLRLLKNKDGTYKCDEHILSEDQSEKEIADSIKILNDATNGKFSKQDHLLIRFPYGRGAAPSRQELHALDRFGSIKAACRNLKNRHIDEHPKYTDALHDYRSTGSKALDRTSKHKLDHLGWNHDSGDSSSEVTKRLGKRGFMDWYVKKNLRSMCSGSKVKVSLFHDLNKSFNVEAINKIVDIGKCLGIDFVSYDQLVKNESKQLTNTGVLVKSRTSEDGLMDFLSNTYKKVTTKAPKICKEASDPLGEFIQTISPTSQKKCKSSNGKTYTQCQGSNSICISGKWHSKSNVEEVGRFCPDVYKTCYSKYSKKTFKHCQKGATSACINGKWVGADSSTYFQHCF